MKCKKIIYCCSIQLGWEMFSQISIHVLKCQSWSKILERKHHYLLPFMRKPWHLLFGNRVCRNSLKSHANVGLNDILVEVFVWVTPSILIPIPGPGLFELEFSDIPSTFHCSTQITFNWSALQFQRIAVSSWYCDSGKSINLFAVDWDNF